MLNYKILQKKPVIALPSRQYDGEYEDCQDLLSSTFDKYLAASGEPIIVNKYYVARPDLISQAIYHTDEYADILCKINGISNPFELNENMLIVAPSIEFMINATKLIEQNPAEIVYDNQEHILERTKILQKRKNSRRSSNEQIIGESNYVIDKSYGVVFY